MKFPNTFQFVFGAVSLIAFHLVHVDACKCLKLSPEKSFCNAQWVSRAFIIEVESNVLMPAQTEARQVPESTKYEVQHVKVFKNTNKDYNLSYTVYTPELKGACGLLLEQGHEYLLAGYIIEGTLIVNSCGQILPEQPIETAQRSDILEWRDVPSTLLDQLKTGELGKDC